MEKKGAFIEGCEPLAAAVLILALLFFPPIIGGVAAFFAAFMAHRLRRVGGYIDPVHPAETICHHDRPTLCKSGGRG